MMMVLGMGQIMGWGCFRFGVAGFMWKFSVRLERGVICAGRGQELVSGLCFTGFWACETDFEGGQDYGDTILACDSIAVTSRRTPRCYCSDCRLASPYRAEQLSTLAQRSRACGQIKAMPKQTNSESVHPARREVKILTAVRLDYLDPQSVDRQPRQSSSRLKNTSTNIER